MAKNPRECEGCNIYYITSPCFASLIEGCPCKSCLVKIVCRTNCEDLGEHLNKAKAVQKEQRKKENNYEN